MIRKTHAISRRLSLITARILFGMTMMASCQAQDKSSGQSPEVGRGKQPLNESRSGQVTTCVAERQ
jgi:hypothetical protein